MIALLLVVCLVAEPSTPDPPAQVHAISGQGGLTAGLDASGVLTVLRWPNPGGANMMCNDIDAESIGGGRWGIEINGAWRWVGDPEARVRQGYVTPEYGVIETTIEWPDGVIARQRTAVSPFRDALIVGIDVTGVPATPRMAWIGAIAPTTAQVPEMAAWGDVFEGPRTFAAFVDRAMERVWNFRPAGAGERAWTKARMLARTNAAAEEWAEFPDGVWIMVTGNAPMRNAVVSSSARDLVGVIDSGTTVFNSMTGRAYTAIEPSIEKIDTGFRSWIKIDVLEKIMPAIVTNRDMAHDVPMVFSGESEHEPFPEKVMELDARVLPYALRHVNTLRALHNVRGLEPSQARVWPREDALIAWSQMFMGRLAIGDMNGFLGLVRTYDRPRQPYGSMPESVTSGKLASPHFVVDDRGPARVVWVSEWAMRERATIEARVVWLDEHWSAIEAAGNFLSTWSDARRGAPLWCDDPVELSDAETQDRLFAAHAGMSAAIRLAEAAGEIVPDTWCARRDQLRELADWVLTTPGKWQVGEALVLELDGLSEEALLSLHENTLRRLENPIGLAARPLASLLLQAALLHRHAPGLFDAPSDRVVTNALARIGDMSSTTYTGPDSFVSAQVLIALHLLGE